ncbi:HNH endonuclease [Arthrobacter saudimassiliensis]|uniref:HNH endonuclease n=1 Tax=Arthrobacter saudimassiliensis TaxID=1461584 RepID=A0A078MPU5_9MICC|nr:HNH endonuclease [Arthrobacter saudimassiliensis]
MFEEAVVSVPVLAGRGAPPRDWSGRREPCEPGRRIGAWIAELSDARTLRAVALADDRELIDRLRELEELKAAASALQARAAAALDHSVRAAHAAAGLPPEQQGRGVGAQIALARRESPARGGRILGFARALTKEMPCTLAALSQGRISEWRATLLVRETACLTVEDRGIVDEEVAGNLRDLEELGDGRLIARIRKITCRLDQHALIRRAAKAKADRYVSCRPAPDTMTWVTGLLPVAQGVAVYAALSRAADSLRANGDARTRGQIMADTMVERITGLARADRVPLEVQLVMTDRALLAADDEPAYLSGYGVVPAMWARQAARTAGAASAKPGEAGSPPPSAGERAPGPERAVWPPTPAESAEPSAGAGVEDPATSVLWLRRLYADPSTGELVALESRARFVPSGLARFILARDRTCRTPWCDAPIRHQDHILPHRSGGTTRADNLQGLCEACNQAKEAPGWKAAAGPEDSSGLEGSVNGKQEPGTRHTVTITTPTGHRYRSTAPPLPGGPGTGG